MKCDIYDAEERLKIRWKPQQISIGGVLCQRRTRVYSVEVEERRRMTWKDQQISINRIQHEQRVKEARKQEGCISAVRKNWYQLYYAEEQLMTQGNTSRSPSAVYYIKGV